MEHFLHFIFWVLSENIWTSFPHQPGLLLSLNFHLVFISVTQSAFMQSPCSCSKNIQANFLFPQPFIFLTPIQVYGCMHLEGEKKADCICHKCDQESKIAWGLKSIKTPLVQSKASWLSRQVNEKKRATFCRSVFPKLFVIVQNFLSFMKVPPSTEHSRRPLGSM